MTDPRWLIREIAELERRMADWPDWKRRESGTNCNTVILTVRRRAMEDLPGVDEVWGE